MHYYKDEEKKLKNPLRHETHTHKLHSHTLAGFKLKAKSKDSVSFKMNPNLELFFVFPALCDIISCYKQFNMMH